MLLRRSFVRLSGFKGREGKEKEPLANPTYRTACNFYPHFFAFKKQEAISEETITWFQDFFVQKKEGLLTF